MSVCSLNDPNCFKPTKQKKCLGVIDDAGESELKHIIHDGSLSLNDRMKAFRLYCNNYPMETVELLQQLLSMYCFSSSSILENMIIEICERDDINIPTFKKFDCFKTVYSGCDNLEKLIGFSRHICDGGGDTGGSLVMMVDNLRYLHSLYTLGGINNYSLYSLFFNNQDVDCEYRYRELISLFTRYVYQNNYSNDGGTYSFDYNISDDLKKTPKKTIDRLYSHYIVDGCTRDFVQNKENNDTFRILTLQYTINVDRLREWSQEKLIEMSKDVFMDYNKRADCVDVILSLGDETFKKIAGRILLELGDIAERSDKSIYAFKQNVHMVDKCTLKEFRKLVKLSKELGNCGAHTFKDIQKIIFSNEQTDEIKVSMQRIRNDNYKYEGFSMTDILIMVWKVYEWSGEQELKNRLMEELTEMSNTCTSGHVTRLVNALSGFNFTSPNGELVEFLVGINWEDQIYNYLQILFMKKIRELDDSDYQGDILIELDGDTPFSERKHLYQFYITNINDIIVDIKKEFIDYGHIDDRDFDEYMSMAIVKLTT